MSQSKLEEVRERAVHALFFRSENGMVSIQYLWDILVLVDPEVANAMEEDEEGAFMKYSGKVPF